MQETLTFISQLFLNLDVVLGQWVATYGVWIYAMLFLVIFMETGVVVTPFLPGDSLLFAAGAVTAASGGALNVWVLLAVLLSAAILGDACNYAIGRRWGRGLLDSGRFERVIKPHYIADTEAFFARHGGKTISFARFFPFVRTFAPFIAGMCHMDRARFLMFNVVGGIAWVALFVGTGYFFGNIPAVAENMELLVIGIIVVTLLPTMWHGLKSWLAKRRLPAAGATEE